jgi:transposase
LIANGNTPQKHVRRARIVLLAGDGVGTDEIQRRLGASKPTIRRWRTRYMEAGVDGLCRDKTRPPGKAPLGVAVVNRVLEKTVTETPPAATHWSLRTMAKAVGIAPSSVQAIWKAHGLKPHLVATFKLSNDPRFAEKVEDIVGLYFDPPEHAIVLSVDEKSQIQALDRSQPGLPMKKGRAGTMTHDYKRHGTTTLFAALNVLDGKVIGQCMQKHRHQEFIRFLNKINRETPKHLDLHLIVDNYAAHKTPEVKRWLKRHPRFHIHFTPTSASWLNLVERFFAEITRKRIRRGVFHSIVDLQMAINDYLNQHNADPKPFVWTASAGSIIEKVNRGKQGKSQSWETSVGIATLGGIISRTVNPSMTTSPPWLRPRISYGRNRCGRTGASGAAARATSFPICSRGSRCAVRVSAFILDATLPSSVIGPVLFRAFC